jgi:predicted membrane channel-forming protein YqfA (hemolysin III family)
VQPARRFHLVFSLLMGAMMISLMTFVITAVNIGFADRFVAHWTRAFLIAYLVGVPVIFFLAPVARKLTAKLLGVPLPQH